MFSLTFYNFEGILPYFILYHTLDEHTQCDFVTCSGQGTGQKLYIVVENVLICNQLVLLFYSVISHVPMCALFLPSAVQLAISHFKVFSFDIKNMFNVAMTFCLVGKTVNTFLSTLMVLSSCLICTFGYQNYFDDNPPFYENYVSRSLVSYISFTV